MTLGSSHSREVRHIQQIAAIKRYPGSRLCGWTLLVLVGLVLATGCTTKTKAKTDARAAYLEGQRQGLVEAQDLQRTTVRFIGRVNQPFVEWNPTITLTEAIIVAGYQGHEPTQIIIHRHGQPMFVDPKALLEGEEVPLMPGDTVELRP